MIVINLHNLCAARHKKAEDSSNDDLQVVGEVRVVVSCCNLHMFLLFYSYSSQLLPKYT